jgi:hypothetical protein
MMKTERQISRKLARLNDPAKTYGEIVDGILAIAAEAGVRDMRAFYEIEGAAIPFVHPKIKKNANRANSTRLLGHAASFEYALGEIRRALKAGLDITALKTLAELRRAHLELRRARRQEKLLAARQYSEWVASVARRKAVKAQPAANTALASGEGAEILEMLCALDNALPPDARGQFETEVRRLLDRAKARSRLTLVVNPEPTPA